MRSVRRLAVAYRPVRQTSIPIALFGCLASWWLPLDNANAGGFGVREQSAYFLGSSFAGSAAGGDVSSMFWNSAATAARPGCNSSSNFTAAFGEAKETAQAGIFVTGVPAAAAPGLSPTSADVGT